MPRSLQPGLARADTPFAYVTGRSDKIMADSVYVYAQRRVREREKGARHQTTAYLAPSALKGKKKKEEQKSQSFALARGA